MRSIVKRGEQRAWLPDHASNPSDLKSCPESPIDSLRERLTSWPPAMTVASTSNREDCAAAGAVAVADDTDGTKRWACESFTSELE